MIGTESTVKFEVVSVTLESVAEFDEDGFELGDELIGGELGLQLHSSSEFGAELLLVREDLFHVASHSFHLNEERIFRK